MPFLGLMMASLAAMGALAIIVVLTFYLCLALAPAAGVVLLVVASRLRKNPDFMARHRVLAVVCRVLGIVAILLGVVAMVLYTAVLIQFVL